MPDGNDDDQQLRITNLVNDAVITDADSIESIRASQFHAAGWAGIFAEIPHTLSQTAKQR